MFKFTSILAAIISAVTPYNCRSDFYYKTTVERNLSM